MSTMGARITRVITNFNLENRVHREMSKLKPRAAPRHPTSHSLPQHNTAGCMPEEINQRNDPLLSMLKDVYVESKDPQDEEVSKVNKAEQETDRRLLKFSLPGDPYGICDVTDVPKGKLTLVEALTVLNNHKQMPKIWTTEKMAQEYSLDPNDAKALVDFFIPFDVKIIQVESAKNKQINDS
ncbi:NADH dehydrogenase [ubiquinone] 1 alpha subcomplex assembly factor 4 isoform X2 [Triplophysa dalaica]|uniref:NADH dehydrogenase [ubiquinone] 1 alpha subcomplex assembly factor 4 isoform X2 n=1 Tax=Triplophysa dalaica TaxID=1582913 RepID=UPI0024DF8C3A|nr:NADH dehydrogenase [ubiquinone] 1 alpha subcomplex assembly factor 4 isoform X2 [Triplophysa dalaica]